jgi:putative endonuclease
MKLAHNYYVYVLQCSDGFYYTGVTNNVDKRVEQHNEGLDPNCFTFKRRPVILKYYEHFVNIKNAIAYEKQLKGWSRKKKEALINKDYNLISQLAKSKNSSLGKTQNNSDYLSFNSKDLSG